MQATELTGGDDIVGSAIGSIEATLKADLERNTGGARGVDHPIGIVQGVGDGLFAEHRLACLGGGHDDLGVVARRRGDDHRLDGRIGQQVLVVARPARAAEGSSASLGDAWQGIRQPDELRAGDALTEVLGVVGADESDADDGDADGRRRRSGGGRRDLEGDEGACTEAPSAASNVMGCVTLRPMAATRRLTVAQATIEFLTQQYVERDGRETAFFAGMFGIFGHGNVAGLGEALEQASGRFRYYQARNEQGMVHAAVAFAKRSFRLRAFACTSSIGPGATNMLTGAATATINRLPVLLLPGDLFATRQVAPVLQQLERPETQDVSVNDCFKPVSRYWDRINRPEQLVSALPAAMRVLTSPPRRAP